MSSERSEPLIESLFPKANMLHLVCPCGHSRPYPEQSGTFTCSRCSRKLEVNWFEGKRAFDAWHAWMLARAFSPRAERGSAKYFVTSQTQNPGEERSAK